MSSQSVDSAPLNEGELRAALENLTEGLIIADEQGRFVFFNREAERILGLGARDVSPKEWASVYGCYLPDQVTYYPGEKLPLACVLRGEEAQNQLIFIRNPNQPSGRWIARASTTRHRHRCCTTPSEQLLLYQRSCSSGISTGRS